MMDAIVEITDDGTIVFHLDMSVYSRPAVMKVLDRWICLYAITYQKTDTFDIAFQPLIGAETGTVVNSNADAQQIGNELLHEMLRTDIIAQTTDIRKLLIGRALYATCIQANTPLRKGCGTNTTGQSWEEDSRRILSSWEGQR
jgi:hypothetical protein